MESKNQTVVGIVFLHNKQKVLLVKRRDVPVWVLPGGGIENKENLETAVLREILEETGYTAQIIRKIAEYTPTNKLTRYTHVYECKVISGIPTINSEVKEIQFFDAKNLPKLIPPPYPDWIKDALIDTNALIRKNITSVTYLALIKNLLCHPILVIRFLLTKIGLTINT